MPEIKILYRYRAIDPEEVDALVKFLQEQGVIRFSLAERPLKTTSFSVYDVPLEGMSRQSHNVIIRIYLHPDQERVDKAQDNADELQEEIYAMLNSEKMVGWRGKLTVGVSISLTQIAWAGGEGDD